MNERGERRVISVVEGCDFKSFPTGGVLPFLQNCLRYYCGTAEIRLVGLSTDPRDVIGAWRERRIGDRNFPFLPVAFCSKDTTDKPSWVPNRAKMMIGLLRHRSELLRVTDVVWVHSPELAFPFLFFGRDKRLVVHLHGISDTAAINSRYQWIRSHLVTEAYRCVVKAGLDRADRLICVSDDGFRRLGNHPEVQAKSVVIPTSVDIGRFGPASEMDSRASRAKYNIPQDLKVVGFLGRLNNSKRPRLLLEAFECLANERDDVGLVLIGDGELRQSLEQEARRGRFADRIFFLGKIAHSEIAACLGLVDVGCLPSKVGEGFPLTVLEFLACGVPVVASEVADLVKVVRNGETGFIVPTDSATDIASRLDLALNGAARMKDACLEVAGRYSAEEVSRAVFGALEA